jgi:hypothetical protein
VHALSLPEASIGARGITACYYRGARNITADVQSGTYATGSVAAGDNILLRLMVKVSNSSAARGTITATARSVPGTPLDAVRVAVKARG